MALRSGRSRTQTDRQIIVSSVIYLHFSHYAMQYKLTQHSLCRRDTDECVRSDNCIYMYIYIATSPVILSDIDLISTYFVQGLIMIFPRIGKSQPRPPPPSLSQEEIEGMSFVVLPRPSACIKLFPRKRKHEECLALSRTFLHALLTLLLLSLACLIACLLAYYLLATSHNEM